MFWSCRFSTLSVCMYEKSYTKIFFLRQETKIQKYVAGSPSCFTSAFRGGKVVFLNNHPKKSICLADCQGDEIVGKILKMWTVIARIVYHD